MSYRCGQCGDVVGPGITMKRKVTQTREAIYPHRMKAFKYKDELGKIQWKDDPGGVGHEIVKEIPVCTACEVIEAELMWPK